MCDVNHHHYLIIISCKNLLLEPEFQAKILRCISAPQKRSTSTTIGQRSLNLKTRRNLRLLAESCRTNSRIQLMQLQLAGKVTRLSKSPLNSPGSRTFDPPWLNSLREPQHSLPTSSARSVFSYIRVSTTNAFTCDSVINSRSSSSVILA